MTWLLIAIIAQIILGTASIFDALLLRKRIPDPWVYAFWSGALGILSIFLLPFGFASLALSYIFLALFAGALFVLSFLLLWIVLQKSEASSTLPLAAAFIILWTLLFSFAFLENVLTFVDLFGVGILCIGVLLFFAAAHKKMRGFLLVLIVGSSILYGSSIVLQKIVFNHTTSFITGFFWIKIGGALCAAGFLFLSSARKKILQAQALITTQNRLWYFANRGWAALGSIMATYAVSLSHPALVESTESLRYAVIFVASWIVLRERASGRKLVIKIGATLLVIVGIIWIGLASYARSIPYDPHRAIQWGVTFSDKFSRKLGLDPYETLDAILYDLHPSAIRLIAYWDEIEPEQNEFYFKDLDWQIAQAKNAHVPILLQLGLKSPRWPECFVPDWAAKLSSAQKEDALLDYMRKVIVRYRDHAEIQMWQVENEPFLHFGLCPKRTRAQVGHEVALVHDLDGSRPVLITDGGEFGGWYEAAKESDVFGTTMYRQVYPPTWGFLTGVFTYPFAPSYYRLKENVTRFLLQDYAKQFIVIELQGEPWGKVEIPHLSAEEQTSLFPLDYFQDTIAYAKESGFSTYYLWGAEWWYAMATKQNNWAYWDEAKKLFHE